MPARSRGSRRRLRLPARLGMLAPATWALAPPAAGAAPAATAALDFGSCVGAAQRAFQCATLAVPLDHRARARALTGDRARRSGARSATLALHVQRQRAGAGRPVLLALAGGPGQSASALGGAFAEQLRPLLRTHQLVLLDQRGTGQSGALRCPSVQRVEGADDAPGAVRACARRLGSAARFYRTSDSVADIEALRRALGVRRLSVYGVSYGTFVATQYARTHPRRVARLVLDSVMGPRGWDPLLRPSYAAIPRVLSQLCAARRCAGVTTDPVGDTAALVRRIAAQGSLEGPLHTGTGDEVTREVGRLDLFQALFAGDLAAGLRALYPGAVRAALQGDPAPVVRLAALATGQATGAGGEGAERLSVALNIATNCQDTRFPWRRSATIPRRRRGARALARATPARVLYPFDAATAGDGGLAAQCVGWPRTSLPGAVTTRPLPDVPALLLNGDADLRTPDANALALSRRLPRARSMLIANQGHSVVQTPCGQRALRAWAAGRRVPARCRNPRLLDVAPVPPPSPAAVTPVPGLPGDVGRTLAAVRLTVADARLVGLTAGASGAPFRVGGLRAGTLSGELAGRRELRLDGYGYVPGVTVDAVLALREGEVAGELRVTSPGAAGTLRLRADGSIEGRLGGVRVEVPAGAGQSLASASLGRRRVTRHAG